MLKQDKASFSLEVLEFMNSDCENKPSNLIRRKLQHLTTWKMTSSIRINQVGGVSGMLIHIFQKVLHKQT